MITPNITILFSVKELRYFDDVQYFVFQKNTELQDSTSHAKYRQIIEYNEYQKRYVDTYIITNKKTEQKSIPYVVKMA